MRAIITGAVTRSTAGISKSGHYANGDWVHIRGGPHKDKKFEEYEGLRFES